MDIQELIESLRILWEYDNSFAVAFLEDEVRVTLRNGVVIGDDDIIVLKEFGWVLSEGEWVRWT